MKITELRYFIRLTMALLVSSTLLVFSACGKKPGDTNEAGTSVGEPEMAGDIPALQMEPAWTRPDIPYLDTPEIDARVDEIFLKMSVEERIGQIIQAEIQAITPEQAKKYHIGSILNGGGSMPHRKKNPSKADWLKMADAFYEASMDTSDGKVAIPILWGTDAVHGHGNVTGATIYPHNIGLGAANNPELIRNIGQATAREVRATGMEWIFAPTIAVAQNDRWGRAYESYSEKPEIVASYAKAMVEGMQGIPGTKTFLDDQHVIATAKHFLADGGTENGDDQGDVLASEEELWNIHGAGYRTGLQAGVQTVMASFNSWKGEKVHGSKYLMTDVLKGKLGFEGFIVGDWNGHGQIPGCTNASCPQSLAAGLDMYMVPNDWEALYHNLLKQYENGEFGIGRLNDAVKRILRVKVRMGLFDAPKPSERFYARAENFIGNAGHRAYAQQAVRESLVLLKNKNKLLPLSPASTILVAGDGADDIGKQSGGWSINWQGVTKGNENFPGGTSIYAGIKQKVEAAGGKVILSETGEFQQKPDVAVVVFGENPYAEGMGDINSVEYQPGNKKDLALLKKFNDAGIPVVSIFISGRPLWVNPELNASDAFVAAWLPGSEGSGVADVLVSEKDGSASYDFKGRLSFSWPKLPTQDKLNPHDENYDPLFAYGYGLTYASGATGPGELPENVEGRASESNGEIDFYVGKPLEPWRVFIRSKDYRQFLSGGYSVVPSGDVKVSTIDKDLQEDALHFSFINVPFAQLTIEEGAAVDLSHLAATGGSLSLDIQNIKHQGAKVELLMLCGQDCERTVALSEYVANLADKGWQTLKVNLSCFAQENDSFDAIPIPFAIRASGSGELGIANIRFVAAASDSENGVEACPG